jgi:AcrR family transcriptional regulator
MVQKEQTRIGRPRGYDPDTALSAALGVFWDKGFQGTSLDDLTAATAMNRPSLYAAFGDKRAIYAKALAAYKARSRASLTAAMGPEYSLREAIGNVYRIALDSYVPRGRAGRGCFMIGSALTEAVTDPVIRKDVSDGLREIEKRFAGRFRAARGELGGDPVALAKIASAALYSMAIQARAGEPRKDLEAIGKAAIDLIAPRSQDRARR